MSQCLVAPHRFQVHENRTGWQDPLSGLHCRGRQTMAFRRSGVRAAFAASVVFAALAHAQVAPPAPAPIITGMARTLPVVARSGMVAAQETIAANVGANILLAGGNAVDAAVAV